MTMTFSLTAMDFTATPALSGAAQIVVPQPSGWRECKMRTQMFFSAAGSMVLGCSTLAPKNDNSAASSNDSWRMLMTFSTRESPLVNMPPTSVQIWISDASSAAPRSDAV